MRRNRMIGLAVALVLIVIPAMGSAQVRSNPVRKSRVPVPEIRDWQELSERVRPMFLRRLGEELALDETTLAQITQSFDHFHDQYRALRGERRDLMKRLRTARRREAPEDEVKAILDDYDSFNASLHRFSEDRLAKIRQIIGTRRYSQYVLLRTKLLREIRKKLK